MHATLWKVTGDRWDKVEELNIPSPPPRALYTPNQLPPQIRESVEPSLVRTSYNIFKLWRVWEDRGEAVYVQTVQENKGSEHE